MPIKAAYTIEDVQTWFDENYDDAVLICRSFLGQSKDTFEMTLRGALSPLPAGSTSYRRDRQQFLAVLKSLGLLEVMAASVNRQPKWSDILVERLRAGRGSAISGQKRGRGVEDFAETIVEEVFGTAYDTRCTFRGPRGETAKCDIAIPSKEAPRIVIEAKGYGATGSKMTDVLGDIRKIVDAKRPDTSFLFFTDGLTWRQRKSDLRQIVEMQNSGDITRIYTYAMEEQFRADLQQLKDQYRI